MKSQLDTLCEGLGITITSKYGAIEPKTDWQRKAHGYKCTLRYQRRTLTVPFWMGSACTNEPTAADVLACLCLDAQSAGESFEAWCSDLGYDPDSRAAERTYRECRAMVPRLHRFLGASYERVCNTEH